MDRAVYSKTSKLITVAEYIELEGTKLDHLGLPRHRAQVTCPACGEPVHTVGEGTGNRANVWAHDPNPNGPWCPIKTEGGARYELLAPTTPDEAAGEELRASFLENWKIHWGFIIELAPVADIHAFENFIRNADRTRFWQHVDLQEWQIAYAFLALCDFPPKLHRTEWLRFMFDNKVRTFEDLWIRTEGDWKFLKMRYRKPRSGIPGPSHYIDCDIFNPEPNYASRALPSPHPYQVGVMLKAFGV